MTIRFLLIGMVFFGDGPSLAARAGLVTVSFEQVILWNPEVIFTTDPNFWRPVEALLGEPGVLPR